MSEHLESANQQLDEITTNTLDTVKGVDQHMTQKDVDAMVKHHVDNTSEQSESFGINRKEQQTLYLALSSYIQSYDKSDVLMGSIDVAKNLREKLRKF